MNHLKIEKSFLVGVRKSPLIFIIFGFFAILLITGQIAIACICVQMHLSIRTLSKTLSHSTYQLQKTLYYSVLTETTIGMLTTSLPITAAIPAALCYLPNINAYVNIGIIVVGSQITLSTIAQCYFITPFRKAILNLVYIMLLRKRDSGSIRVTQSPRALESGPVSVVSFKSDVHGRI